MSEISAEERLEIFKEALEHYKDRISIESDKEENEEIKSLLDEFWKTRIQLLDEILKYVDEQNHQHINQQLDRYRHAMCVSVNRYLEDLKRTKSEIEKFEKIPLDFNKMDDKIRRVEAVHEQFCREHLLVIEKSMKFPTF